MSRHELNYNSPKLTEYRKKLRNNMTRAEVIMELYSKKAGKRNKIQKTIQYRKFCRRFLCTGNKVSIGNRWSNSFN